MKSLELTLELLDELGSSLGIDTTRDSITIADRTVSEGDSFLTITLPNLEKSLLEAISRGWCDSSSWPGFRTRKGLPVFLQGFLRRIFPHVNCGARQLSADTDEVARYLRALRQILVLHGKVFSVCDERRVRKAVTSFVETDKSLAPVLHEDLKTVFNRLFGDSLRRVEASLYRGEFFPRHGPGAVSEKLSSNQKWLLGEWTEQLQAVLPWWDTIRLPGELIDGFRPDDETHHEFEPTLSSTKPVSRLVAVPKTAKAPRLIAIEPAVHQFVQQGLFDAIETSLRGSHVWRYLNWRDQGRNQSLARLGSIDGSLATLDLSEASDRVSWSLVQFLFSDYGFLLRHIEACRTEVMEVPEHGLIRLRKFASMGSALTFPIESMVFFAIAWLGVYGPLPKISEVLSKDQEISVYGDDIIVPVDKVPNVVGLLESCGFRVNPHKSFWTGLFRESCGSDFYAGHRVTPVRVRHDVSDICSSEGLEKTISLRNRLFEAGWYATVRALDTDLGHVPFGPPGHPALCRHTFEHEKIRMRWSSALHRAELFVLRIARTLPLDPLDGWRGLFKWFSMRERTCDPLPADHLERAGRPRNGRVQYGWTSLDLTNP